MPRASRARVARAKPEPARAAERKISLRNLMAPRHFLDMDMKERQKVIDLTLVQLDKQFGKGSVLRLGSRNVISVDVIPSGSISVDAALGIGGFPRGRVVEVFGPESSGKTTLALQVIAQAQKAGGAAAFVDAEHALDPV
jgi:recombination protein RecA